METFVFSLKNSSPALSSVLPGFLTLYSCQDKFQEFKEEGLVKDIFEKGVDLREYAALTEKALKNAEKMLISDCKFN